jgi:hypothetical protein
LDCLCGPGEALCLHPGRRDSVVLAVKSCAGVSSSVISGAVLGRPQERPADPHRPDPSRGTPRAVQRAPRRTRAAGHRRSSASIPGSVTSNVIHLLLGKSVGSYFLRSLVLGAMLSRFRIANRLAFHTARLIQGRPSRCQPFWRPATGTAHRRARAAAA